MSEMNRENMVQLRDWLHERAAELEAANAFHMHSYRIDPEGSTESLLVDSDPIGLGCGASACMVGWAPNAGIEMILVDDTDNLHSAWYRASRNAFGLDVDQWDYAFDEGWPDSIAHGVARLNRLLAGYAPTADETRHEQDYAADGGDDALADFIAQWGGAS